MYHIFFICSSVDCHLGYFHVFAIINNAVMNIGMHLSFQCDFLPSDFYSYWASHHKSYKIFFKLFKLPNVW